MTIYHYVDGEGIFRGSFNFTAEHPGWTLVPSSPISIYQRWDGERWLGQETDLFERYGAFRTAMLSSAGWQMIKGEVGSLVPEFMGAIAYMDDNPGLLKRLWNSLIGAHINDEKVLPEFVDEWQGIIESVEIGVDWIRDRQLAFDFDNRGFML